MSTYGNISRITKEFSNSKEMYSMYSKSVKEVNVNSNLSIDFPRQFSVVWVDLPKVEGAIHQQYGLHPAVVLSSDNNNKNNSNLTVFTIILL